MCADAFLTERKEVTVSVEFLSSLINFVFNDESKLVDVNFRHFLNEHLLPGHWLTCVTWSTAWSIWLEFNFNYFIGTWRCGWAKVKIGGRKILGQKLLMKLQLTLFQKEMWVMFQLFTSNWITFELNY